MIELLAPASTKETLNAAIKNGADAVYLGLKVFNARRRAQNFRIEKLEEIINYTHKKGVKVYITLNTLIKNKELKDFFNTVSKIYEAGADAVIVQSIALANIIKKNFPNMEVHLSTQATITNSEYKNIINVDRVILPRELSLDQIKLFIKNSKIDTEVFVQGALCFSYSGQCLFSSFVSGKRSGNRGLCTQPCRLRYNKEYLLSMKDLCLVDKIPELIKTGIKSLKIEGRLRSPSYVASATRLYRKAIDSYYQNKFKVDQELLTDLTLAFNREFTEGYTFNNKNVISQEISSNRGIYLGEIKNSKIKLESKISVGDGLGIWRDGLVNGAIIKKITRLNKDVEKANKGDRVDLHLKLEEADKIYKTSAAIKKFYAPLNKKEEIITKERKKVNISIDHLLKDIKQEKVTKELLVKVYTVKEARQALEQGATKVFYPILKKDFPIHKDIYGYMPRIITDEDVQRIKERIKLTKGVLLGNLGLIKLVKNKEVYIDYSANTFNELDLNLIRKHNAIPIISPELSSSELKEFKNKNFAVLVHGDIILMNTKHSINQKSLIDDKEYEFPVVSGFKINQVLNSKPLGLFNKTQDLVNIGINKFYIDIRKGARRITSMYSKIINGQKLTSQVQKGHTSGHFGRELT